MQEITMAFVESEVEHWDTDETSGQMRFRIALKTVLSKFPKNHKVKICRWESRAAVEAQFFPRLSGVRFENWIAMNFEQTSDGSRMLTTYGNLLENLSRLAQSYGKEHLNEVLLMCDVPRKCTLGYVKAVLKNSRAPAKARPNNERENKYLAKIDKLASQLM